MHLGENRTELALREHARIYKNDPQHPFTWGVEGNSSTLHIADCSTQITVCSKFIDA
jgi:hypothetical protein